MKKSSFLHNPKDMLSKTFKPAKCKITLKLATSRMKLLKNKKDVQLKQMKRELSQLLESGQDQTARIRVEHVIREEKMMAAYELLDIYCELIVARLPIIESQKGCPIDLKEAITSVIFASPRCGDVPELLDARKHFSAKYGKEFVSAAVELRPNCGVSRLLVEKLSANAPDGQTKIKALTKIAEEHNIKWDPKSFGQSDMLPPDDLLNGPKAFEKASTVIPEDPPKVTPNFQSPPSHYTNQPSNFSQQNVRSSPGNENFSPRHSSMSSNTTSSIPHTQMRPSVEVGQEQGQVSQSFQGEGSSSFSGESWSMEFKDATSAAKAAAESAERASLAARAAAELSSRVQTARQPQYSSEAHNSIGDVNRDERTAKQATPKHTSDYLPQDSAKSSLSDRQPRFQNKPTYRIEQENRERLSEQSYKDGLDIGKGYGHISSSRSKASVQDETFARSVQVPDGYSRKSLSKEEVNKVESSMQRQSGKSESEGTNHLREGVRSEKFDYSGEEMIRKQPSILSSMSNSGISDSDDDFSNSGQQKFGHDAGKGWVVGNDEEQNARENLSSSYHGAVAAPPVVFDDSGSDGEDIGSNIGFKLNEESNFHFASPGRNSPSNLPTNTSNGSLTYRTGKSPESAILEFSTKKHSFTEISESLKQPMDGPQEDNFGSVTFDDSDGESSEVEIDMPHSEHTRTEDSRDPLTRQNQSLEVSDSETHRNYSQKTEIVESSKKFSFGESPISQSSLRLGKSQRESDSADSNSSFYNSVDEAEYRGSSQSKVSFVHEVKDNIGSAYLRGKQMDDENLDDGKQLNFKKLTGGFRQKGYSHPPYTRSQLDGTSSSSEGVSEDVPTTIRQSADASTVESYTNNRKTIHVGDGRISKVSNYYSDSDSDSSMEKLEKQPTSLGLKSDNEDVGKDVKIQTSLRGSATYFDSKSSDSEDDSGKQVVTGKNRLGSGFSRRTKPSSSSSTSVSKQKAGSSSRVHVNSDSGSEGTPTTRSYGAETPQEPVSWNRNSDLQRKSEQPGSAKVASKANFETAQEPVSWNRNSDLRRKSEQPGSAKIASKAKLETAQEPASWNRNSDLQPKSEQPGSAKIASKANFETAQEPGSWNRYSDLQQKSEQHGSAKIASKANFETVQEPVSWNRDSDLQLKVEQPGSAKVASKAKLETPQEPASWSRYSDLQRKSEQPGSAKVASKAKLETPQEPASWNRNSDLQRKSEQPGSAKVASKANLVSHVSLPEKNLNSSVVAPPASAERKAEKSENPENQKAPSGTTIGREDSSKKASHVHPKLPDYDTLAAKLQALRTDRR